MAFFPHNTRKIFSHIIENTTNACFYTIFVYYCGLLNKTCSCSGDPEKTQKAARRLPERTGPEPAVCAHVFPRDGLPTSEDHAVAEFVRAPSVRSAAHATGDRRQPGRHAAAQDAHLHGPVQISRRRCVQACDPAPGRQPPAVGATAAPSVVFVEIRRERVALETTTRYVVAKFLANCLQIFSITATLRILKSSTIYGSGAMSIYTT